MYKALYRTYRPETFENLLGQEHIVKILKNQIATGTTSHAYLFSGTRGTGKTTVARILAKAVNCNAEGERPCGQCKSCLDIRDGLFMDVIEIDAASNNGVDNIRELKESVKYPPTIGKMKVYIIDEVHMLSTGAFNALLKTLEEPPENVMFILATTEIHKLPATILSRCLRLDFRRVSEMKLKQGIRDVCQRIQIQIEEPAIGIIAGNADGSVRDCLSILDQCLSSGDEIITRDRVLEYLGTPGEEVFVEMTNLVITHHIPEALALLQQVLSEGKEVRQFMKDWISHYRNLMLTKFVKNPEDIMNMSCENVDRIREQSQRIDMSEINEGIMLLSKTLSEARWTTQPRILLEMCIVNLASSTNPSEPYLGKPLSRATSKEATRVTESEAAYESKPASQPAERGSHGEKGPSDLKPSLEMETSFDLEALWHRIFEDGETTKGSYNLIRTGTVLRDISPEAFLVEAISEIKKSYVLDNQQGLEHLMEKHTGQKRMLKCHVAGASEKEDQRSKIQETKTDIEKKFGISIEIE